MSEENTTQDQQTQPNQPVQATQPVQPEQQQFAQKTPDEIEKECMVKIQLVLNEYNCRLVPQKIEEPGDVKYFVKVRYNIK